MHDQTSTHPGVHTRNRDERARGAAPAVLDVHLRAPDVELRALERARDVQRDLFYAHQVLSAWQACGDRERHLLFACPFIYE